MSTLSIAILICHVLAYLIVFFACNKCSSQLNDHLMDHYKEFVIRYKKKYLTNSSEFLVRFNNFKDNIARAKYMNKAYNNSNQLIYGINKFADLTPEEFKDNIPQKSFVCVSCGLDKVQGYNSSFKTACLEPEKNQLWFLACCHDGQAEVAFQHCPITEEMEKPRTCNYQITDMNAKYLTGLKRNGCMSKKILSAGTQKDNRNLGIPQKFDWREKGVLTHIKDQGTCGACWSFSIVETMESMYAIEYKSNFSVPDLSVQQVIDCDSGNNGCQGGDICEAAKWAYLNGVVNESTYPLTDRTDNCKTVPSSLPRVYVKDYMCNSFQGQETQMLKLLVEHGPIAAAVDATTWHNYIGGIIQFHCSANINHAVQIVGYDLTGDVPYYIIRNSWGANFGDHGFLYVKYGENLCGLAIEVSHLNVTGYK